MIGLRQLIIVAGLALPGGVRAHEIPPGSPFGAERDIAQIGVNIWSIELSPGEKLAFRDASTVVSVWHDDPEVLAVRRDGDTIRFTALKPGKAFVRFIWKFDTPSRPTPDQLYGVGMARETLIVRIKET